MRVERARRIAERALRGSLEASGTPVSFDQAIAEFSERYADQNELDYAALADAAKSGRIEVERDLG